MVTYFWDTENIAIFSAFGAAVLVVIGLVVYFCFLSTSGKLTDGYVSSSSGGISAAPSKPAGSAASETDHLLANNTSTTPKHKSRETASGISNGSEYSSPLESIYSDTESLKDHVYTDD